MKKKTQKQIDKEFWDHVNKETNERIRKSRDETAKLFKELGFPYSPLDQQRDQIRESIMDFGSWIVFLGIIFSLVGFFITGLSASIWLFLNFSMGLGIAFFGFNLFVIGAIIYKIGDHD